GCVSRDEVTKALAAALPAVIERAEVSIAIYAFPRERIVGDRRARGLTLAECGTAGVHIGGAARPIDWQRREVRLDLIPFRRDVLPEAARAEPSFLGNDLNDSGRRVGAVQR